MGMIPPIGKEREKYIAGWALKADAERPRTPLVAGMRVYCVLYGTMYKYNPWGTVVKVLDWKDVSGVLVLHDDGGQSGSAASHYVPVPDWLDEKTGLVKL